MTERLLRRIWCNIAAALFAFAIVAPLAYMSFDRDLPLSLHYQPFGPVQAEQVANITWSARIYRLCEGTFVRRIIDSGGFIFDSKPMKLETFDDLAGKSHGMFTKQVLIPHMLPGPATYQIFTTYWCNPLQRFVFPIHHDEEVVHFEVVGELAPPISGQSK